MISEEQVYNFVSEMDEGRRLYSNPSGFCFFLKLDDKALDRVRTNPRLLTNPLLIKDLLFQSGDNIHFIGAYGKGFQVIRYAIRDVAIKEKAKSVSWCNKDMTKFIYRRIKCPQ